MARMFLCSVALLAGLLVLSPPASARQVFLNGVNLSSVDLPEITLKGCDVHVDAKGNIHITARGYKIQLDDKGNPGARPDPNVGAGTGSGSGSDGNVKTIGDPDSHYYLVSFFNTKGATQYDIEVFINGQMIRRIRAHADQVAMDITRFVKRGQKNEIIFVSRKSLGVGGRKSTSEMDYFRVVLGSGFESKGQIVLKQSLLETRRTAAEIQPTHTEKHTVVLR